MHKKRLVNFIIIFLLFFGSFSTWATTQTTQWAPSNWSIVVSSCDKYSALWEPFFKALEQSWPELSSTNKNMEIYLIANAKQYNHSRVKTINISNERSWSDNMLTALDEIDSKYILLFLEDYWVTQLDQRRLMELMERFEKEDAAYMELWDGYGSYHSKGQKLDKIEGVAYKGKFESYRASLQLALWEKKALQQLLRSGEDIWTFELAASIRSSGYPKPFFGVIAKPPITYLNAVYQGHIHPFALEFAQQQGVDFHNTMPIFEGDNWNLRWQRLKRKVSKGGALIKRHTIGSEKNAYYYLFED